MTDNASYKPIPLKSTSVPHVIGGVIIAAYLLVCVMLIGGYALTPSRLYNEGVESYNEGDYVNQGTVL